MATRHAKHDVNNSRGAAGNQQESPCTTSMNPSLRNSQPDGMHLQQYQPQQQPNPFRTALQTSTTSTVMSEMQRRLLEMNTYHFHDIVKLTRRTDQHSEAIMEIKEAFTNDMQILEHRIDSISQQQKQSATELSKPKADCSPSEQMQHMFSKEKIAEAYLDEADQKEVWAEKLREQAELMWPGCVTEPTPQTATPPTCSPRPGHLICETPDAIVEVLVQHIENVQGRGERVDSAYSSPVRVPAVTPPMSPYVCCEVQYLKVEDLINHVQYSHTHLLESDANVKARQGTSARGTQTLLETAENCMASAKQMASVGNNDAPAAHTSRWLPLAIRNFSPLSIPENAAKHTSVFSWSFLTELLGGKEWYPGYFFNGSKNCILPSHGYWLVEVDHDPFMPVVPGQHGAKLTAFFNQTVERKTPGPENYVKAPVFVSADGGKTYRYMGMYSQPRFSDKVGYDTLMEHVPAAVLQHHAEQLAQLGRPEWVTECLRNHFWPMPAYEGSMPTDSACNTPKTIVTEHGSGAGVEREVLHALEKYAQELKSWEKDSAMKVALINVDAILDAFTMEDGGPSPSLRLWWEYFQCVGYDSEFYDMLVKLQKRSKTTATHINFGLESTPTHDQIKTAGESKKWSKAPIVEKSKAEDDWDYIPQMHFPPPALHGASSRALQKKLNREHPGVDAASLPATQWSTPSFEDDKPGEVPVAQKAPSTAHSIITTAAVSSPKPEAAAPSIDITKPFKALPPHLAARAAKAKAAASASPSPPAPASPIQGIKPLTATSNPFTTSGNLDLAKPFAKDATVAGSSNNQKKAVPPHLRGK